MTYTYQETSLGEKKERLKKKKKKTVIVSYGDPFSNVFRLKFSLEFHLSLFKTVGESVFIF